VGYCATRWAVTHRTPWPSLAFEEIGKESSNIILCPEEILCKFDNKSKEETIQQMDKE